MPDISILRQYQALPLRAKESMSLARIREWYDHWDGNVYVSFSGGKDSTVLAYLVHEYYPDVPLVFVNTGLEYPEIQDFARRMGAIFLRPKMAFSEVVTKYGYPLISKEVAGIITEARVKSKTRREMLMGKRLNPSTGELSIFNKKKWMELHVHSTFKIGEQCCAVMKKHPAYIYERETSAVPFIGTLTEESSMRQVTWVRHGCNAFDKKRKTSQPMSFWKEQDVLAFIKDKNLEIASVYGDIVAVDKYGLAYDCVMPGCECTLKCTGAYRTGCIFCGFGAHLDKGESRFQRLARTHPKQYDYCMRGGNG